MGGEAPWGEPARRGSLCCFGCSSSEHQPLRCPCKDAGLLRAWPVGSAGGAGHGWSALGSTAGCFAGYGAGQEGMVWEAHLELYFCGGLLPGPCKFTASPAPALPAWMLLSCLGVCLSPLTPHGCPWSWESHPPGDPLLSLLRTHHFFIL